MSGSYLTIAAKKKSPHAFHFFCEQLKMSYTNNFPVNDQLNELYNITGLIICVEKAPEESRNNEKTTIL